MVIALCMLRRHFLCLRQVFSEFVTVFPHLRRIVFQRLSVNFSAEPCCKQNVQSRPELKMNELELYPNLNKAEVEALTR